MSPDKSLQRLLTFEATQKYIFPDRHFIGPRLPVDDYRLAAGILFERYNDHTARRLHVLQGDYPCILVSFVYDFSLTRIARILVTPEVVAQLQTAGVVAKSKDHLDHWRLSLAGKRAVVEEWFDGCFLTDFLAAGATLDLATNKMAWIQYPL